MRYYKIIVLPALMGSNSSPAELAEIMPRLEEIVRLIAEVMGCAPVAVDANAFAYFEIESDVYMHKTSFLLGQLAAQLHPLETVLRAPVDIVSFAVEIVELAVPPVDGGSAEDTLDANDPEEGTGSF